MKKFRKYIKKPISVYFILALLVFINSPAQTMNHDTAKVAQNPPEANNLAKNNLLILFQAL
ncbi:hypothetical protein C1631_011710 [Chryseobacterium phosphatilyticum]|uniref:Uncharacterized protein n=1 Tax=Chryseobacterium phosphatilyticum TaxID=475075 RepID=A0A316XD06_9FLAO|nr:hypothetical protein [Chryseobacterium phosphatilyticum]PWN70616.1 hypothetical protein C1631_011710 [Chryseobacterium phosphatilyticum]